MAKFKEWALECTDCRAKEKFLGWDRDLPRGCECGGCKWPEVELKRAHGIIPDDIPGGMVMEHVEPGRKVYSKTELKQVLADHRSDNWPSGCRLSENGWCGETDQHLKRMVAVPWDMQVTREDRQKMMAEHLGMTLEAYQEAFA